MRVTRNTEGWGDDMHTTVINQGVKTARVLGSWTFNSEFGFCYQFGTSKYFLKSREPHTLPTKIHILLRSVFEKRWIH